MAQPYSESFFQSRESNSAQSARIVVPIIQDLVHPASVIDVGCGIGSWTSTFLSAGIDAYGIDGAYVNPSQLVMPEDRFAARDLSKPFTLPEAWPKRYDLAVSLEVAEHLPPAWADEFVDVLAGFASAVLFSAAIPHQGGTHHVNEQWQTYWAEKFGQRGYLVVDIIRPAIWGNADVSYTYAQNTLLYVKNDVLKQRLSLKPYVRPPDSPMLSVVHPRKWDKAANPGRQSIRKVMRLIPVALKNHARKRGG